jgi:hypothetical protein
MRINPSSIYSFEAGRVGIPLKKIVHLFDKMDYRIVVFAVRKEENHEQGDIDW